MNYEQDYIMRMIYELIRTMLKLLFNIDNTDYTVNQFDNEVTQAQYTELTKLVKLGKINEAENRLFIILEKAEKENLKLALLFYECLNELDDDCLNESDYSRAEIELGIKTVAQMYGYEEFANTFLS